MADGQLTQEEIDALLSGAAFDGGGGSGAGAPAKAASPTPTAMPAVSGGSSLTEAELKALGERLKTAMASAAQVTATVIGQTINLAPISIDAEDDGALAELLPPDGLVFTCNLKGAAAGQAAIVYSKNEALTLACAIMGIAEKPTEIDDLNRNAAREVTDKLLDGICRTLSRELMAEVQAEPAQIGAAVSEAVPLLGHGKRILSQFSLQVGVGGEGNLSLVLDMNLARALAGSRTAAPATGPLPRAVAASAGAPAMMASGGRSVPIQQVQFPALAPTLTEGQSKNIEILLDVPMQITVELGRTSMMIRDVLELGTGSIIELDKLAGEPVDLLVNAKLIARGEVVVIDENFGVRVTDIISPMERLKGLQ